MLSHYLKTLGIMSIFNTQKNGGSSRVLGRSCALKCNKNIPQITIKSTLHLKKCCSLGYPKHINTSAVSCLFGTSCSASLENVFLHQSGKGT